MPRTALFAIGNFAWAAGCLLLLGAPGFSPSALCVAWILAQLLTGVVLGELQWMGLRRQPQRRWA